MQDLVSIIISYTSGLSVEDNDWLFCALNGDCRVDCIYSCSSTPDCLDLGAYTKGLW